MAIYVLVHGAGHGGWCWETVAAELRSDGHRVYTPTLTGLGERSRLLKPAVDLELHIADVTAVLRWEDLNDVVLVGHSYGGMVITGVADRALSRIRHMVYLDAAIPRDGESLMDLAGAALTSFRESGRVENGVELVLFPADRPLNFYGVTDPESIAWMRSRLTPHPWKTFEQPLRLVNPAALAHIPRTHINCTSTLAALEEEAGRRALDAERAWEIDTAHDLMITEPAWVAEMLLRLA